MSDSPEIHELTALRAQLAEAEDTMKGAWASLGERSTRIEELKHQLAERDATIQRLREALAVPVCQHEMAAYCERGSNRAIAKCQKCGYRP